MEKVIVYSPVEDQKIKSNLNNSPIWKDKNGKSNAYTEEEYLENPKRYPRWWKYTFRFEGLKPVQHTKTEKIVN
jgi:hypothetical protein